MFFQPPRDVSTTVFARLPDELRRDNADNEGVRAQPAGGPSDSLLQGPSFDAKGNLWCVDLPNGRFYRITPDGRSLFITESGTGSILRAELDVPGKQMFGPGSARGG